MIVASTEDLTAYYWSGFANAAIELLVPAMACVVFRLYFAVSELRADIKQCVWVGICYLICLPVIKLVNMAFHTVNGYMPIVVIVATTNVRSVSGMAFILSACEVWLRSRKGVSPWKKLKLVFRAGELMASK